MQDKKVKVKCCLTTHGTDKANAKAIGDLNIPDPEPDEGKKIIEEELDESENS